MNDISTPDLRDQNNVLLSQHIVQAASNDNEMKKAIILFEFKLVQLYSHKLGLIILPLEDNIFEWHGLISIQAGLYTQGKFKFILTFPHQFPQARPRIRFLKPVCHPMISQNGLVDVDKLLPDWKYGQECMMYNLFNRLTDMFLDINYFETKDSLNPEVADLYRTNLKGFVEKISEQVNTSKDSVYEKDRDFSLRFNKPNDDINNFLAKVEEVNEKKTLSFQEKKKALLSHIFAIKQH